MGQQDVESNANALVRVCAILRSYSEPWWIAGGWALDLHSGETRRAHKDIDIAVLRQNQQSLRQFLSGWSTHKMVHGKREPWSEEEYLALPIHEIHAEQNGTKLEFLLNEAAGDRWLFRRNLAVSIPLSAFSRYSPGGTPYLCPQVVLLYKAKNPRPIDHEDFERTLPMLQGADRRWLVDALEVCHPGHEWLPKL